MAATVRAGGNKAAAKKSPPPRRLAPQDPAPTGGGAPGFEPLRLSSKSTEPDDLVELFEVDDVMYSVPRKPRANIALQYLDAVERLGPEAANLSLLRAMLGPDGYRALSTCESLTSEHLEWVLQTVHGLAMGTMEAPKA